MVGVEDVDDEDDFDDDEARMQADEDADLEMAIQLSLAQAQQQASAGGAGGFPRNVGQKSSKNAPGLETLPDEVLENVLRCAISHTPINEKNVARDKTDIYNAEELLRSLPLGKAVQVDTA